jgi:hypothetical protein
LILSIFSNLNDMISFKQYVHRVGFILR